MFGMSPFWIPIVAIVAAFTLFIVQTVARARVRELEIRERIAMIERGMVPAPEADPRGFDRAMAAVEQRARPPRARPQCRHRRAGVTLMGVGFGLMVMIAFAGREPAAAIGVGGFLVVLGIAFFVNSLMEQRDQLAEGGDAGRSTAPPTLGPPFDPS
jgi:hypothetical protein